MNIKTKDVLAILIVILTMTSLTQWSSIPIGSTFTDWVLFGFIIFIFINSCYRKMKPYVFFIMANPYYRPI